MKWKEWSEYAADESNWQEKFERGLLKADGILSGRRVGGGFRFFTQ